LWSLILFTASQARKELASKKRHRDKSWVEGVDERYQTDPQTGEVAFVRTIYYYNTVTNESTYDKPIGFFPRLSDDDDNTTTGEGHDDVFSKMKQAFEGNLRFVNKDHHRQVKEARAESSKANLNCVWLEIYDVESLSVYYFNKNTQETQWHRPPKNVPVCVMEEDDDFLSAVVKVQTLYRKKMARIGVANRLVNKSAAAKHDKLKSVNNVKDLLYKKQTKRRLQFVDANGAKGWDLLEVVARRFEGDAALWKSLGDAHASIATKTHARFHFEEAYYAYNNSFGCEHDPAVMLCAASALCNLGNFRGAIELLARIISRPVHNEGVTLKAIWQASILLCHPSCLKLETAKSYANYVVQMLEEDSSTQMAQPHRYSTTWMNFIYARILERHSLSKRDIAIFGEAHERYDEVFKKLLKEHGDAPIATAVAKQEAVTGNLLSSKNALRWMHSETTWKKFGDMASSHGDHGLAADAYMKVLLLSYARTSFDNEDISGNHGVDIKNSTPPVAKLKTRSQRHPKKQHAGRAKKECRQRSVTSKDEARFLSSHFKIARGNGDDVIMFKSIVDSELGEASLENDILMCLEKGEEGGAIFGIDRQSFLLYGKACMSSHQKEEAAWAYKCAKGCGGWLPSLEVCFPHPLVESVRFHEQTLVSVKQSIRNRRKRQQRLWHIEVVQSCVRRHLAARDYRVVRTQCNNAARIMQRLFRAKASRSLTKLRRLGIHGFKKLHAEDFLRDDPSHIESLLVLAGIHFQLQVGDGLDQQSSGVRGLPIKHAVEEAAICLDRALIAEHSMRKAMSGVLTASNDIRKDTLFGSQDYWLMRGRAHFQLWVRWEHQFNCLQAAMSFDVYLRLARDSSSAAKDRGIDHASLVDMEIVQTFIGVSWWDRAETQLQALMHGCDAQGDAAAVVSQDSHNFHVSAQEMELLLAMIRVNLFKFKEAISTLKLLTGTPPSGFTSGDMLLTIARVYDCWKWAIDNNLQHHRGRSFVAHFLDHECGVVDHPACSTILDSYSPNDFAKIFTRVNHTQIVHALEKDVGICSATVEGQDSRLCKGAWFRANVGEGLLYYFEEMSNPNVPAADSDVRVVKLLGPLSEFELYSVLLAAGCSATGVRLPMRGSRNPSFRGVHVEVSNQGVSAVLGKPRTIYYSAPSPTSVDSGEHFERAFDWMKEHNLHSGFANLEGWKSYSGNWTALALKFRTEIQLERKPSESAVTSSSAVAHFSSLGISKTTYGSFAMLFSVAASRVCPDHTNKARCCYEIARELHLTSDCAMALQLLQQASSLAPNNVDFAACRRVWRKGESRYEGVLKDRIKAALATAHDRWVAGEAHAVHHVYAMKKGRNEGANCCVCVHVTFGNV
jgi:hypothetical protein